jgi:hypothetical protein
MLKITNILRKTIQMTSNLMKFVILLIHVISYNLNHFCAPCERFENSMNNHFQMKDGVGTLIKLISSVYLNDYLK